MDDAIAHVQENSALVRKFENCFKQPAFKSHEHEYKQLLLVCKENDQKCIFSTQQHDMISAIENFVRDPSAATIAAACKLLEDNKSEFAKSTDVKIILDGKQAAVQQLTRPGFLPDLETINEETCKVKPALLRQYVTFLQ